MFSDPRERDTLSLSLKLFLPSDSTQYASRFTAFYSLQPTNLCGQNSQQIRVVVKKIYSVVL